MEMSYNHFAIILRVDVENDRALKYNCTVKILLDVLAADNDDLPEWIEGLDATKMA